MKSPTISLGASAMNIFNLFLCVSLGAAATISQPSGKFGVSMSSTKLIDTSRTETYAPDAQDRAVMISLFYPSGSAKRCNAQMIPYMPPATAAFQDQLYSEYGIRNGTFGSLELFLCTTPMTQRVESYPLVIFSPGLGNSRHMYNAIAQSVASFGYVVATIDHPYDAEFIEFPDGTIIKAANITSVEQIVQFVDTRAKDIKFVLDELNKPSIVKQLIPSAKTNILTKRVAVFGHSLGGVAAATVMMMNDTRIIGGVNLDGMFYGPVIEAGIREPFLLFGHEGKNQTTDASWGSIWPRIGKRKLELMLNGAQHGTFTDMPLVIEALGLTDQLPAEASSLVGTLLGTRAREIITAYLVGFFESVLGCDVVPLLRGENEKYPEVVFVDGNLSGKQ